MNCAIEMPLHLLRKEEQFEEIILERRLNVFVFTVCWSLGSKMIHPTIVDLASHLDLAQIHFYRIDLDESNRNFSEHLNIVGEISSSKEILIDFSIFRNPFQRFDGIFMEIN